LLYDKLKEYSSGDIYPMHIPGHKRNGEFSLTVCSGEEAHGLPFDIDITEVYGFDDLHNAKGVLLESNKLAARLYGSFDAFMLVNGTTVGILAAIGACCERGDKILAADNCHWSTMNAARLFGLEIEYLQVEIDDKTGVPRSVSPAAALEALNQSPDIKLIIVTSPSYEGVISDVQAIADIVHGKGGILVVDSAHGAHLGFSDDLPKSAVSQGADIVVVSLHKTLPALTQCSLLHVCSERIDIEKIQQMLYTLQTSSPSYVLMASIDNCLRLLERDSDRLFREYKQKIDDFYNKTRDLQSLSILCHTHSALPCGFFDHDPGRIVISTKNTAISSTELADKLREDYKIEIERIFDNFVIAVTSICDTAEGITRLADALCALDS